MYKILNWLFGWDYVHCTHMGDKALRVCVDAYNKPFFKGDGYIEMITDNDYITWLTCTADKYIKKDVVVVDKVRHQIRLDLIETYLNDQMYYDKASPEDLEQLVRYIDTVSEHWKG